MKEATYLLLGRGIHDSRSTDQSYKFYHSIGYNYAITNYQACCRITKKVRKHKLIFDSVSYKVLADEG